jgi:hypothetical protein
MKYLIPADDGLLGLMMLASGNSFKKGLYSTPDASFNVTVSPPRFVAVTPDIKSFILYSAHNPGDMDIVEDFLI